MLTRISLATALALGLMAVPGMANEMNKDTQAGTMDQTQSATTGQSSQGGMQSANLQDQFSEFDADSDGAISQQEWTAKQSELDDPPAFSELNSESDAQGEQKITMQEWNEHFGSTTGAGSGSMSGGSGSASGGSSK